MNRGGPMKPGTKVPGKNQVKDQKMTGAQRIRVIRRLGGYMLRYKPLIAAILFLMITSNVLSLIGPTLSGAAIDAIALFESGLDAFCDITVAVTAPEDMRIRRLMERDGISREYAQKRIAAQHTNDWYQEKCTYTLDNNGRFAAFRAKCIAFLQCLGIMKAD